MHGAKDHIDPTPPPLRLVGGPDDYDALAELFLGSEPRASRRVGPPSDDPAPDADERDRAPAPRPEVVVRPQSPTRSANTDAGPTRSTSIEALILGHLPVRSSPWVSQYARARAEQLRRPIGLLRVQADQVSLDMFGAADEVSLAPELGGAIEQCRRLTGDWIIQVDELNEPTLAADDRLSAITLLTSANETAVIAAYRAIKGLASAQIESGADLPAARGDTDHPSLRVGIMGASLADAQTAMARLRNACSVFLGKPLELAACVERVGPSGSAGAYRGLLTLDLPTILTKISAAPAASVAVAPAVPAQARAPVPTPAASTPSTEAQSKPAPSAPAESASAALASHLPGLRPLAARCPDDGAIELALDEQGRLNLLRLADAPDACQRLLAAVGWAQRHAALIALTVAPEARFDAAAIPVPRLFVSEPKAFRAMLDSSVRLHLLAQAAPGAPWLCLELN